MQILNKNEMSYVNSSIFKETSCKSGALTAASEDGIGCWKIWNDSLQITPHKYKLKTQLKIRIPTCVIHHT
jgi:hypothetical protein